MSRKIVAFGIFVFLGITIDSQQIVINDKLLSQITVNHGVRLVVSRTAVTKFGLSLESHPLPYSVAWVDKSNIQVTHR